MTKKVKALQASMYPILLALGAALCQFIPGAP